MTLAGRQWLASDAGQSLVERSGRDASIDPVLLHKGLPGQRPRRVVEIHHPGSVAAGYRHRMARPKHGQVGYQRRDEAIVEQMLAAGMRRLVGCDNAVDAWRFFFARGDRVGIKVVPVGQPNSISSYELVRAVIKALRTAGVRGRHILVFERYRNEFVQARYPEQLPEGIRWGAASVSYDHHQLALDGQSPHSFRRETRVFGYDRDVFRELPLADPTIPPGDDRRFRSHVTKILTQEVDKFISIPVLKDHRSAGVTLSLKNLSHGLVNNVARSHIRYHQWHPLPAAELPEGGTLNQCGVFIPAIVSLPPIREKATLQILDGLVGTWEGGPGIWNPSFATWPCGRLLLATDAVALDWVGWQLINQKRAAEGWPAVERMGLLGESGLIEVAGKKVSESFHMRQPQHIPLAAALGLGTVDSNSIEHIKQSLVS